MAIKEDEQPIVYSIPKNFIDKSTVLGGEIATRNAIEGAILVIITGYPIMAFLNISLTYKIIIAFTITLPFGMLGVMGIKGEPITSFVLNLYKYTKNRRIIGMKECLESKYYKETLFTKLLRPTLNAKTLDKRKGKTFSKSLNSASSYIPVEKIENGIVYTTDKRYLKVVEISSINFLLRSVKEQKNIIYNFTNFFKVAPVKFQIKVIAKKADINIQLEKLDKAVKNETDIKIKTLQEDYKELLLKLGQKEAVMRRFYIIFEYDKYSSYGNKHTESDIISELENVKNNISQYFISCGNEIVEHEDQNYFLMDLFYNILNRDKSATVTLKSNIKNTINKYIQNGWLSELEYINVNEFLVPNIVDLSHHKYIKIDNIYHSYLIINSQGYKNKVLAGWTSNLVNAGEGIDVDFFFNKQIKETIQRDIGRKIRQNRYYIKEKSDTNADFDNLSDQINSGYYLKNGLANGEEFYYVTTLITVTGYTAKEVIWRTNEVKKLLISQDLKAINLDFRHEKGLMSALPLNNIDKYLYKIGKRNILSSSVASFYPFTSFQISDDNGILLGTNKHNNSMVIVDIFNSQIYKNANIAILGTSGSGKTFLLQLMALRFRLKSIQVFIIAPLKGHEFYRACKNINGEFIQISASSQNCINVMEIRKVDTIASELIDEMNIEKSLLADKIQRLHIFFSLLIPDITHEERQLLDEALIETYKKKGITHDNDSLIDTNNPEKFKEMPILGDAYNILKQKNDTRRIANILNRLVNGSARSFSQQTNVNLDNMYTVLDISELSGDLLILGMFVCLDFTWDKSKENRTKEKAIFMDELWRLISSNKLASEYVLEIFKIIRGYGGSAACATQDINDFFALEGGKYGKGIINNCKTKLVLQLENDEAEKVQDILKLSESETMSVINFKRGNGLISTNSNNVAIEIKASQLEKELITTDRAELKAILKRKERELDEKAK